MNKKLLFSVLIFILFYRNEVNAEPIALRNNLLNNQSAFYLGYKEVNVFTHVNKIPVSVELTLPYNSLSVSTGKNFILLGNDKGFGLDSFLGGGLGFTTLNPGLLIDLTPTLKLRYIGETFGVSMGVSSPSKIKISTNLETRFPLLLELSFIKNIFDYSVGIQVSSGAVFVPNLSPSLTFGGGLYFGW